MAKKLKPQTPDPDLQRASRAISDAIERFQGKLGILDVLYNAQGVVDEAHAVILDARR